MHKEPPKAASSLSNHNNELLESEKDHLLSEAIFCSNGRHFIQQETPFISSAMEDILYNKRHLLFRQSPHTTIIHEVQFLNYRVYNKYLSLKGIKINFKKLI